MKQLAIGVLLTGVFLYQGTARNSEYRRLIEAGDKVFQQNQIFLAIDAFSGTIALKDNAMLAYPKRSKTNSRRSGLATAYLDLSRANDLAQGTARQGDVSRALGRYQGKAGHDAPYVALTHRRSKRTMRSIPLLNQETHSLLGITLRDQNRLDDTVDALAKISTLSHGIITAREALSDVFANTGRINLEVKQFEALATCESVHLATSAWRSGDLETTQTVVADGLTRYPSHDTLLDQQQRFQ